MPDDSHPHATSAVDSALHAINVQIAGRVYVISVAASDEDVIRALAREISEKVAGYEMETRHRDKQDALAMTLLSLLLAFHRADEQARERTAIHAQVAQLHQLLDEALVE